MRHASVLIACSLFTFVSTARAGDDPPTETRSPAAAREARADPSLLLRRHLPATSRRGPVEVSLRGWRELSDAHGAATGVGLLLSLPLDRVAMGSRATDSERLRPAVREPELGEEGGALLVSHEGARFPRGLLASTGQSVCTGSAAADGAVASRERASLPAINRNDLLALLRAAFRTAGVPLGDERLDDLATRSRSSATLPELRLRALHSTGELLDSTSVSDTPIRTRADGHATMLYEARATWRLDRLVFADDEVSIERLRAERHEQQVRLRIRVVEALTAWQNARALADDPDASVLERQDAELRRAGAETLLDAISDGVWSTMASTRRGHETPP